MLEHTSAQSAALAAELRNLMQQTELLIGALGADRDAALIELRQRVEEAIAVARQRLLEMEERARRAGETATAAVDAYVQSNPWTVVSTAGLAGFLLGALLLPGRRAEPPADPC